MHRIIVTIVLLIGLCYSLVVLASGMAGWRLPDNTHSYLSDPVYPTLLAALVSWARGGAKPTPQQIAQQCEAMQASFGPGCRFRPDYRPRPLSARVAPRD